MTDRQDSPAHILLTGASRGIGKAVHEALADRGARVVGQSTAGDGDLLAADFESEEGAARLWQEALDRLDGRIDILVNNAGIFESAPIAMPDEEWRAAWRRTMQVNLAAAADLSRLAVRHFAERGGGRLVHVASRAAYRGDSPDHWHYAASKAGMVAMHKTIARAYAADGIYSFAICPGFVMTGMAEDYLESRGGEKLLRDIPLGKVADPPEIAAIAAFCALDAPPSMTGAVIDANGASFVR